MRSGDRAHVLLVHDAYADYVVCLANALAERIRVTMLHSTRFHSRLAPALSDAPGVPGVGADGE